MINLLLIRVWLVALNCACCMFESRQGVWLMVISYDNT